MLKESLYSSSKSNKEESQSKKLKVESKSRHVPLEIKTLKPIVGAGTSSNSSRTSSNTERKPSEQIEKDAAIALALQMENVDNMYAALFTIDDEQVELSTNEEINSDDSLEMFVPNKEDNDVQTTPSVESVVQELAQ